MNENYIVINGKRAELTEEQLTKLGIKVESKDTFSRIRGQRYFNISDTGSIDDYIEDFDTVDDAYYTVGNYCKDKALLEQRALHETLSRLLWRYSLQHGGDAIDWNNIYQEKYRIYYDYQDGEFHTTENTFNKQQGAEYFINEEIAQTAIEEIIKPFMEKHPEFVW